MARVRPARAAEAGVANGKQSRAEIFLEKRCERPHGSGYRYLPKAQDRADSGLLRPIAGILPQTLPGPLLASI